MGYIVVNPEFVDQLRDARQPVEVRDSMGRVIGTFHPRSTANPSPPFSRGEIEEQRKQRSGRPLSEILDGLSKR